MALVSAPMALTSKVQTSALKAALTIVFTIAIKLMQDNKIILVKHDQSHIQSTDL